MQMKLKVEELPWRTYQFCMEWNWKWQLWTLQFPVHLLNTVISPYGTEHWLCRGIFIPIMKCYIKVAPLFVRHDKQVIANWRCKNMLHNTFWRSTTVKGGLQKCKICAQTTWIATCEMQSLSVCIIVTSTAQEINLLLQESQRTQLVRRQN